MSAAPSGRSWLLLTPVALALGTGAWIAMRYRTAAPGAGIATAADVDAGAGTIACTTGYEPILGEGCLAVPASDAKDAGSPPPLLVYLHGLYDGNAPAQEIDRATRVAKRATARGFAVLALRGRQGECYAQPEYATFYCWPSNDRTAGAGPAIVASWSTALGIAESRTRARRRYVLGFSNGGYFTVLLATRGLFRADAFGIAGAGIVHPFKPPPERAPLVLVSGDDDPSQPDMLALHQALVAESWPHDAYGRDGGHALTDGDIDTMLTFFSRSETETVSLSPPISTHAPRPPVIASAPVPPTEPAAAPVLPAQPATAPDPTGDEPPATP